MLSLCLCGFVCSARPAHARRSWPAPAFAFAVATSLALALLGPAPGWASSHREAPRIAQDPAADLTDIYAFRTPVTAGNVVMVMCTWPFADPMGAPNYFPYANDVTYRFNIDNDADALPDIWYDFQVTKVNGLDVTLETNPYKNVKGTFLFNTDKLSYSTPNWNIRQQYKVTRYREGNPPVKDGEALDLDVAPANIGPRSNPTYTDAEIEQSFVKTVTLANAPHKFFVGPRDDPFFVDLGGIFDLLNLRTTAPTDTVAGFNCNAIVLEVSGFSLYRSETLTQDDWKLGVWATTYRTVGNSQVQVSRLGNPLVNEVVVALEQKDAFNALRPDQDLGDPTVCSTSAEQNPYAPSCLNTARVCAPELATLLGLPTSLRTNRDDLIAIFLTGVTGVNARTDGWKIDAASLHSSTASEMLRINTDIAPVPFGQEKRLGVLDGDTAGFPNGRRLVDDVTDIAIQAVAGEVANLAPPVEACGAGQPAAAPNDLGDGVNQNDKAFLTTFPYLAAPHQGYQHTHVHAPLVVPAAIVIGQLVLVGAVAYALRRRRRAGSRGNRVL